MQPQSLGRDAFKIPVRDVVMEGKAWRIMSIALSKVSTFNQLISSSPKTYGRRGSVVGVSRSHFKKTNETSLRRGREMHPRPSLDPGYKHQNIQFVFRRTFQSVSSATPVIFFFLFVSFFFQHFCYIFLSPPPPPSPALPSPFTFFFFLSPLSVILLFLFVRLLIIITCIVIIVITLVHLPFSNVTWETKVKSKKWRLDYVP